MFLITTIILIFNTMAIDTASHILFDFTPTSDLDNWRVVDDRVMGGRSSGNFSINEAGHGRYSGEVSLDNNGGFSSLRHFFKEMNVNDFSKICIVLKGDQKDYQIRLKSNRYDRHSYTKQISTTGEWQTIEIQLSEMTPTFRGRQLNMVNYPGKILSEFAILIGNKQAERFELEIDKIYLT